MCRSEQHIPTLLSPRTTWQHGLAWHMFIWWLQANLSARCSIDWHAVGQCIPCDVISVSALVFLTPASVTCLYDPFMCFGSFSQCGIVALLALFLMFPAFFPPPFFPHQDGSFIYCVLCVLFFSPSRPYIIVKNSQPAVKNKHIEELSQGYRCGVTSAFSLCWH